MGATYPNIFEKYRGIGAWVHGARAHLGPGPIGPGPNWARAQVAQAQVDSGQVSQGKGQHSQVALALAIASLRFNQLTNRQGGDMTASVRDTDPDLSATVK